MRAFEPDVVVRTLHDGALSNEESQIRESYSDWFFSTRYLRLKHLIRGVVFRSGLHATADRIDEILFRVFARVARPGVRTPSLVARYQPSKNPAAGAMTPRDALDHWLEIIFLKEARLATKNERRRHTRQEAREVSDHGQ